MNELNYATKEASKRLVEAGIVLEFEFCWYPDVDSKTGWSLNRCYGILPHPDCLPAHSMAEVWRELPEKHNGGRKCLMTVEGLNIAGYSAGKGFDSSQNFVSSNSTDALIDLLIWVRNGGV